VSALPPAAPDCTACAARDAPIAELEDLAGELREAVGAQADQIAALREQVARPGRAQSRNSGISSMPPSSDDVLPVETGRPGLPGHTYELAVEAVNVLRLQAGTAVHLGPKSGPHERQAWPVSEDRQVGQGRQEPVPD
jgi:hypothetical protein